MKRLLFAFVLLAGASPLLAADQRDIFDQSWASTHWAVIATFMEKPRRLAAVLDRESIQIVANGQREFNFLTISEGDPLRAGIVGRVAIDCKSMVMRRLGKTKYYYGEGEYSTDDIEPVALKKEAAVYPAALAACTGDFGKMKLIEGDERAMRDQVFPS